MREIKFRAWDAKHKKWFRDDAGFSIAMDGTAIYDDDSFEHTLINSQIILMQFTGLKINIHPIYESDIVESGTGIGKVIYFQQYCQFMIEHKDGSLENLERAHTHHGNIHEHSNLLK